MRSKGITKIAILVGGLAHGRELEIEGSEQNIDPPESIQVLLLNESMEQGKRVTSSAGYQEYCLLAPSMKARRYLYFNPSTGAYNEPRSM